MSATSAARRIPGLIVCFHRDKSDLRNTDGRSPAKQISYDPALGNGAVANLRKIFQDKVWGLGSAHNPWLVVHTKLEPDVDYNFAWAQMKTGQLMRSLLADADQLVIEGSLTVDDGVKIKGRVAQFGQDGETVFHGFDEASGTFLETVVEQAAFLRTEVYASQVVREIADIHGPLSLCEDLRITRSHLTGLFKIFGRSEEPDCRGLIDRSYVEGGTGSEAIVMRPASWDRVVVPAGSEAPLSPVRAMHAAALLAAVRTELPGTSDGSITKIAHLLLTNAKKFSPAEILGKIAESGFEFGPQVQRRLELLERVFSLS